MANTARAPEHPTIAIAEPDPVLADVAVDLQDLHPNLPTEAFATWLEEPTGTAGPFGTVELEVPAMGQPSLPRSPRRRYAHTRTPSDMRIEFGANRCPICNQVHHQSIRLDILLDILQQVLEQRGGNLDGPGIPRVTSCQQFLPALNGQTTSSVNVASVHPTAAARQQSGALLRDPPRRQRQRFDVIWRMLVFILLAFFGEYLRGYDK